MTLLIDHASNIYSQFGEDGIVEHIFQMIGPRSNIAVEFGAGDGFSCSNTAHLWRDQSWKAYLIEPDAGRFDQLMRNITGSAAFAYRGHITPTGPQSIGERLSEWGVIDTVDFMSIDVDGDDYQILEALTIRPRVISIEFNPTVPPHIELRQSSLGDTFGASLLAIIRLGQRIGYTFIGATRCNAFLVLNSEAVLFSHETDPTVLFVPAEYTYMVTDFAGRTMLAGQALPWEAKEPYVMPVYTSAYVAPVCDDPAYIRLGFERQWGPARWFTAHDLDRTAFMQVLTVERPPLVCLDLSNGSLNPVEWIWIGHEAPQYRASLIGRVLGLVLKDQL
jgi:hypothetical protein